MAEGEELDAIEEGTECVDGGARLIVGACAATRQLPLRERTLRWSRHSMLLLLPSLWLFCTVGTGMWSPLMPLLVGLNTVAFAMGGIACMPHPDGEPAYLGRIGLICCVSITLQSAHKIRLAHPAWETEALIRAALPCVCAVMFFFACVLHYTKRTTAWLLYRVLVSLLSLVAIGVCTALYVLVGPDVACPPGNVSYAAAVASWSEVIVFNAFVLTPRTRRRCWAAR